MRCLGSLMVDGKNRQIQDLVLEVAGSLMAVQATCTLTQALQLDVSGDLCPGFCDQVSLSSSGSGSCWCTEQCPT